MVKKIFDESTLLYDAVDTSSWTVSNHDSSIVNLSLYGGYDALQPPIVQIRWPGITSAGLATAIISIMMDTNATPTTILWVSRTFTLAQMVSFFGDADYRLHLPVSEMSTYIKIRIAIGTAALTGGTLTGGLVK